MTQLSFGQLEQLWTSEGGAPQWAPTMAGVAYAESSGIPSRVQKGQPYSSTGWGLWQITPGNSEPTIGVNNQLLNPTTNAKAAVAKFDTQGIGAWSSDPVGSASVNSGGVPLTNSQIASALAPEGYSPSLLNSSVSPSNLSANYSSSSSSGGTWSSFLTTLDNLLNKGSGKGQGFLGDITHPLSGVENVMTLIFVRGTVVVAGLLLAVVGLGMIGVGVLAPVVRTSNKVNHAHGSLTRTAALVAK